MLTVRDVMTADVLTLSAQCTLREAAEALTARRVSGAPVIDGGRVIGTISASDILAFESTLPGVPTEREAVENLLDDPVDWTDETEPPASHFTEMWEDAGAEVSERFESIDGPEWDVLGEHTVQEAMAPQVIAIAPDAAVQLAAEAIQRAAIHRVLVLDDNRLVGIVTTMDITRAVANYQLRDGTSSEPVAM
jgi:predicted transcriptional regulator